MPPEREQLSAVSEMIALATISLHEAERLLKTGRIETARGSLVLSMLSIRDAIRFIEGK